MDEKIQLRINEIPTQHVGRGIVIVDPSVIKKYGWHAGQILEIVGSRKTHAITQNYDLIKIPGSFRILTEDMESVRKLLESIPNVMDLSNNRLVRIKITVSEESRADVGSSVIGLLHGNGIEFVDAYFSQENMIITFNREDASRAYDVLRSEIG